jgi:hypothetical protein
MTATFWLVIFISAHDGSAGLGAPQITVGPFPTLETCYAAGAIGINGIVKGHDDKDFRGACVNDADILPLQQLVTRVGPEAAVHKP